MSKLKVTQTIDIKYRRKSVSDIAKNVKTRIYVNRDSDTVLSWLHDRIEGRQRPHSVWGATIVPIVLANLGIDLETTTWRWSQKAGCDCGCSPAFILDAELLPWNSPIRLHDIHVTVGETVEKAYTTEPEIPATFAAAV